MSKIRYTGPAKPINTWRRPVMDYIEPIVMTLGLVVVLFDLYVWRF